MKSRIAPLCMMAILVLACAWPAGCAGPALYRNKAEALMGEKRYAEAEQQYTMAIEEGPPSVVDYMNRGVCRAAVGRYEAAIEDFRMARKKAPYLARELDRNIAAAEHALARQRVQRDEQ